jgi:predicted Zn-dependent protease with MMP-like domain
MLAEEVIQYFQEQPQLHQQVVEVVVKMEQAPQKVLEDLVVEQDKLLVLED